MGMSIRAYAQHRGVSHEAVRKAIAAGRIHKEADGSIDPAKADAQWQQHTRPAPLTSEKATDIAARGIDIDALPYVINYELPNVAEDYVHRIGRTGRAGMEGEAISLVCHDERPNLRDIEKLIKRSLERVVIPGFEQSATAAPRPVQPPRGARKPQQPARSPAQKTAQKPGGPQQHRTGSRHR